MMAFTHDGKATAQGEGFLKSLGFASATLDQVRKGKCKGLQVQSVKETQYLFAALSEPGKSTFDLLAASLAKLILNLEFPKKMRWGTLDISYPRPIHWILALFGDRVIPIQVGDVISDRLSFGHAQLKPKKFANLYWDNTVAEQRQDPVDGARIADIKRSPAHLLWKLQVQNELGKRCRQKVEGR